MDFPERWGLLNTFLPISYGRFQKITSEFRDAIKESFGSTECKMTITAVIPGEKRNDVVRADSLTREQWKKAWYVCADVHPVGPAFDAISAWGRVSFKDNHPHSALCYLQASDDKPHTDVREKLAKANPLMRTRNRWHEYETFDVLAQPIPA